MKKHNIMERSRALRENMCLQNLFEIICNYQDIPAAIELDARNQEIVTSFSDYREMTTRYAAFLREALSERPKGTYVGIALDTCKEWFPVFWGVIQAGYNALLLDVSLPDEGVSYLLEQAGSSAVITSKERKLTSCLQIKTDDLFIAPYVDGFMPEYADHVALCTSGTTSTSRIFVYDGKAIAEQVLSSELIFRKNRRIVDNVNKRMLAFLPYHHVLGFIVNLLWIGFLGYSNIYVRDRAPQTILNTARRCHAEMMVAVPLLANNLCATLQKKLAKQSTFKRIVFKAMKGLSLGVQQINPCFGLWLAENVLFKGITGKTLGSQMKVIILGGSHTPTEHLKTLNALGYYTVCGFGMTETAVTSVEIDMCVKKRISGCVGKPLSNIDYCIRANGVDEKHGEMLVRGKSIHTGRLLNGRLRPPELLQGGWYPTGDIVRLEADGRVYIEGRCKDVIINESGENVYPDELEDVFAELDGVEQFTVLGVQKPGKDQKYEDVTLVINVGDRYQDDILLARLAEWIAQSNGKLPTFKRVTRVLVTSERLPLVNGIKVKRIALREAIANRTLPYRTISLSNEKVEVLALEETTKLHTNSGDLKVTEMKQKVRALYAEALDVALDSFDDQAHFIDDLGGDSLQVLSVVLRAEEEFHVLIPVEEYGRCATVNDFMLLLRQKIGMKDMREGTQAQAASMKVMQPITCFEDTPEFQAFHDRQQALIVNGAQNPYFVCHDSPLRDKSLMDGREVLNFGSYNYVGMSGRQEVQEAAKQAIDKYGTSASGSRLLAGEKSLYQELERELAEWKHTERALVLVGGHSTNVTVVGNFCGERDLIVYDALAHNSIEQGCRLSQAAVKPFPHNDYRALESILRTQRSYFEKVLIIIEGAYSMDGDIADVPKFVALKKKYGCFLLVDEAHSACVIGETGGGVDEYFGLQPEDIDIKMGTLSKGLGACGGYLAGPACIIEYMRYNLPGFVFSVGISPPLAAATLQSIRLLRQNPAIMRDMKRNIDTFVREAEVRELDICLARHTAIIPVMVGRDEDAFLLSNKLRENGVFVPPAVYPAVPKNKARLRFCVVSEHQPEQIVFALDTLMKLAKEMGITLPQKPHHGVA